MKAGKGPLHSSGQQDYQTPQALNRKILRLMGIPEFTLDPCTVQENPVGARHIYTVKENGLVQSWKVSGESLVYVHFNPPYVDNAKWIEKAYRESRDPSVVVIGILPVRASPWFHDYILRDLRFSASVKELSRWTLLEPGETAIFYHYGRIKFIDPETQAATRNQAPFDTMIVVWR